HQRQTMKLKILIIFTAIVTTFASRILAQTSDSLVNQSKPNATYLPWPPDPQRFRIIQGKLYGVTVLKPIYSQIGSHGSDPKIEIGSIGKTSVICKSITHELRPNADQAVYAGGD